MEQVDHEIQPDRRYFTGQQIAKQVNADRSARMVELLAEHVQQRMRNLEPRPEIQAALLIHDDGDFGGVGFEVIEGGFVYLLEHPQMLDCLVVIQPACAGNVGPPRSGTAGEHVGQIPGVQGSGLAER